MVRPRAKTDRETVHDAILSTLKHLISHLDVSDCSRDVADTLRALADLERQYSRSRGNIPFSFDVHADADEMEA